MLFEITFDESKELTSVVRDPTGGSNSVPKITVGCNNAGGTINEIMAQIEKAIELAISSGDISNVLVDNTGTTLIIHNLDTTVGELLVITDQNGSTQLAGEGIEGDGADDVDADLSDANKNLSPGALAASVATGEGTLAAIF